MKCPGCHHESFDLVELCKHCGAPMVATAAASGAPIDPADDLLGLRLEPEPPAPGHAVPVPGRRRSTPGSRIDRSGDFVEMLDDDPIEVGEDDLDGALTVRSGFVEDAGDSPFRIDDDLFLGHDPGASDEPNSADWSDQGSFWPATGENLPGPAFALSREDPGTGAGGEPIIDRDDNVPERYWAPEVAGLGRRALALLADQLLLLAVLGTFYLGALVALRLRGIDTGLLSAAAGVQASTLPFALLAAVLSLSYHIFFHGSTGSTPGKSLVGIQVKTSDGGPLTWGRAILRWLGSVLGLVCAGVGIFWAMFEPRGRGWADLISGTVVARSRRDPVDGLRR